MQAVACTSGSVPPGTGAAGRGMFVYSRKFRLVRLVRGSLVAMKRGC